MGEVWTGKFQRFTDVAVKVVSRQMLNRADIRELFYQEVVMNSSVRHPHVVQFFGVVEDMIQDQLLLVTVNFDPSYTVILSNTDT
jgi:serine/threonine protein kinase